MAKIAEHLRMSSEEIDLLMTQESRIRIATVGPADSINLTPMTFGWAGGKVYIFGRGQKIANLRRNPVTTILVDVGEAWRELQGVMMQGTSRVLESIDDEAADPDLNEARLNIGEKSGLKQAGDTIPYGASAAGRSRRWIVFTPEHVVSWNNERLPARAE